MRYRSNNRDHIWRMRSGLLLLAALLAGTVSAQYSEITTYNDEACQDLNSTLVVNGILGSAGVTPFDTCSNVSSGSSQYFGTYECADSEVTLSTYDNEDCSGTSVETSSVYNGSCTESQISSCTAGEPGWEISSNWIVEATFYSNQTCSMTTGETSTYTMAQFMDLYEEDGSCQSIEFDGVPLFSAIRCMDGKLGRVYYDESDSTCSSDVVMVVTDAYGCVASTEAAGSYLGAECTGVAETSFSSVNDDLGGFGDVSTSDGRFSWSGDSNGLDWEVLTSWTVQTIMYTDENCSVANGKTKNFTMSQFMDLYHDPEGCQSFGSLNYATRCIDGKLGTAYYGSLDSTCSLDPESFDKDDFYSCGLSYIDFKSYFVANCIGNMDTSNWSDDDDWDWSDDDDWDDSDDFFGILWTDNNGSVFANSTVQATFYSDENCRVANGQTSDFTSSEFLELYEMNESCSGLFDGAFWGIRCINGNLGLAAYNDSTCSSDVIRTSSGESGCYVSPPGMPTLGAYFQENCTGIVDELALTANSGDHSNDGGLSLYLAGFIVCCSWSIAAAATTALVTAFV